MFLTLNLLKRLEIDVFIHGEYLVYELDLRDLDKPISDLKDNGLLREIIEKRKKEIRVKRLGLGKEYKIPPGILHLYTKMLHISH